MMNLDYARNTIVENVRTASEPLGLALIKKGASWPKHLVFPKHMGIKAAMCQWTNFARREGVAVGLPGDDIACAPCQVAFGFKKMTEPGAMANFLWKMGYIRDVDTAQNMVAQLALFPAGEYEGITAFPLNKAPLEPDVVWIYGNPAQMNHLVIALMHESGRPLPCTAGLGLACRNGFCDAPEIILPGRGERNIGCTGESELFMALPSSKLQDLVAGLEAANENQITSPVMGPLPQNMPYLAPMAEMTGLLVDP